MFDYIIIGAGSAGCVLANRLSENLDVSVLLLEAGGPGEYEDIRTPASWFKLWKTESDWAYLTQPQPHMHQRPVFWPRGKVLGGTSALNAMMYVRGAPYDYDRWAELGNEGWSYAEVLPYFKKSEHQQHGASEFHGVGGPLYVSDLVEPHPLVNALVDAAKEIGIPPNDDFNGATQEGVGVGQVNQKDGQRHSTAAAFLLPVLQRPNLKIETHAHVTRLLFTDKRVTGVRFVQDGTEREESVGREVILSGGAINSPQLLMLSGIGPADHLREVNIPVLVDLPGVGQNLQDHLGVSVIYRAAQQFPILPSSNLSEGDSFMKTRPDLPAPDLQVLLMVDQSSSRRGTTDNTLVIVPLVLRPESRGSLTLASNDPFAAPLIQPNYLDSPADLELLVEGVKIARKIASASSLNAVRDIEIQPGSWAQSDDAIRAFLREAASTVFHPVGTCKMGHDPLAVVNDRLEVHGVQGLRVADASIMPDIISGNTNAPTIMIGEKAADLIKETWK